MSLPLDYPLPDRPHRIYFALTNHCNRSCPWCSTCSSPASGTFLSLDGFQAAFPQEGDFQVQLEGGEPTIHPRFWDFVNLARDQPRCTRLVLCTNGVVLPRRPECSPLRTVTAFPQPITTHDKRRTTTGMVEATIE